MMSKILTIICFVPGIVIYTYIFTKLPESPVTKAHISSAITVLVFVIGLVGSVLIDIIRENKK